MLVKLGVACCQQGELFSGSTTWFKLSSLLGILGRWVRNKGVDWLGYRRPLD